MSGTADDESAPSASTPQSPEGGDGQPDVTVTATKPDTPTTPKEEEESQPPTNEEIARSDAEETNTESKIDVDENTTKGDDKDGDGAQSAEVTAQGNGEKTEDAAPAGTEIEHVAASEAEKEDTNTAADEEKLKPAEDGGHNEEPPKETEVVDGGAVVGESEGTKVAEGGSEATAEATSEEKNETGKPVPAGDENAEVENKQTSDDTAASTSDAPVKPSADVAEDISNVQSSEVPASDDATTEETPTTEKPDVNRDNANEDSPAAENPNDAAPTTDAVDASGTIADDSGAKDNEVLSEMDKLKAENEALRKRVKEVEDEIERIRDGRKEGLKVQADYLARELNQQQDTEKYLREKLAEVLQEKEESERRVKDLQLRMKRFAKDDQAKDARMSKMEKELRDITHEVQILENMLDDETLTRLHEQRASGKVNGPSGGGTEQGSSVQRGNNKASSQPPPPQSKTCIIL